MDGDEKADTVWINTVNGKTTVGVRTAAGGGSTIEYESASPIPRSALVANVDEKGPVEIIVSDGRGASLYAFSDCEIKPVLNEQGETYEFDLQNLRGHGTGIGCVPTKEGRRLVGLEVTDQSATKVVWQSTVIELDGLKATNGIKRTGSYTLPSEKAKAELLHEVTCGKRTMKTDGVTERE